MSGFGFDPEAAVAHLRAADADLAKLIERTGPFALELKKAPACSRRSAR